MTKYQHLIPVSESQHHVKAQPDTLSVQAQDRSKIQVYQLILWLCKIIVFILLCILSREQFMSTNQLKKKIILLIKPFGGVILTPHSAPHSSLTPPNCPYHFHQPPPPLPLPPHTHPSPLHSLHIPLPAHTSACLSPSPIPTLHTPHHVAQL